MKVLIAGLGAGGFAAALTTKKWDRKAEIVLIDPKAHDLIHPCGLPFALEGLLSAEDLAHDQGLEKMNISKVTGKLVSIDPKNKTLRTDGGKTLSFDKLLLATGAAPVVPPIPGIELARTLESPEALKKIQSSVGSSKEAVVIGGGAIGLETAWALKKQGLKVTILEMDQVLMGRSLDVDFSGLIQEYLAAQGMNVLTSTAAESIDKRGVHCSQGLVPADLVINAMGFAPDLTVARSAGLEIGRAGIICDSTMQTSHPDIYAVGDIIETFSPLCKGTFPLRLATTAYRQGVIAGAQMAGKTGPPWEYSGTLMSFVSPVGEWQVASAGLSSQAAREEGYYPLVSKVKGTVQPEWMPRATELNLKLIFDKESHKLIGAQAVGEAGAADRINLAALAMRNGNRAEDLLDLEMAYCPGVSKTWDILNTAVENALRRLKC